MNERAFRLDFFIAMAALIVSALTAATLIYQTRVIGNQYAATIWPYLTINSTYNAHGENIEVVNDGLGPALIRSAQLSVDGKPAGTWNDYFRALATEPEIRQRFVRNRAAFLAGGHLTASLSTSSIGPSTTLRPGDVHTLLSVEFTGLVPVAVLEALQRHTLAIDFCYCSLNGSCWTKHAIPGRNAESDPQPILQCPSRSSITYNSLLFSQH